MTDAAVGDDPVALVRAIVAEVNGGTLTREAAVQRLQPAHVQSLLHAGVDGADGPGPVATGVGASPGAAVGQVYFDVDAVLDAADRGELVILAAEETSPADEIAMRVAEGILTTKGGLASHAAVVARGWGLPAVCGAGTLELIDTASGTRAMAVDGIAVITEGDTITVDGASGDIFVGDLGVAQGDVPDELFELLGWADGIRGDAIGVRANADAGDDAMVARKFGAEGIGLCRTEHMFLGDRLPVVQRVLRSTRGTPESDAALDELVSVQQSDFVEVLTAMDGLPVVVRLLDAPLHEFLPDADEHNPMLGTRGVRLAIEHPELYAAQTRALAAAVAERRAAGGTPLVDIMVPLVATRTELATAKATIVAELEAHGLADINVGTMIETPRAALAAAEIAEVADFFSFGTNDLTQLTFGFSRDDVEQRVIGPYVDGGLLTANPFETVDDVVAQLVHSATEEGRATAADLIVGVCGEHGGDPASIAAFHVAGLSYVSCSPYRVPVARLAAAQTVLAAGSSSGR